MKALAAFFFCTCVAFAQGSGAVVGAGYNLIAPISVAPGQVITIFVTGLGNVTQKISAGNPPLPAKLGGIAAALVQGDVTTPAPIFSVFPFNNCSAGATQLSCGSVTGVTLQIPFELHANIPGSLAPVVLAYLQVSDNVGHAASVLLDAKLDKIHVLHMEDTVLVADQSQRASPGSAAVTHLDGTLVTAAHPAQPGEKLVMYAVGLGATNPPVKTGEASPIPAVSIVGGLVLNYDYTANAQPSPGPFSSGPWQPMPLFVGLAPGFVGLYLVNFQVPQLAPLPCGVNRVYNVTSSMTVSLVGRTSFDGAAICVSATP
jgi:uncharacterized protein (TIGR03437 family)